MKTEMRPVKLSGLLLALIDVRARAAPQDGSDSDAFNHEHCTPTGNCCDSCTLRIIEADILAEIDRRFPVTPTEEP